MWIKRLTKERLKTLCKKIIPTMFSKRNLSSVQISSVLPPLSKPRHINATMFSEPVQISTLQSILYSISLSQHRNATAARAQSDFSGVFPQDTPPLGERTEICDKMLLLWVKSVTPPNISLAQMCPRTDCLWGWGWGIKSGSWGASPCHLAENSNTLLANFQEGGPRLGDSVVQLFEGLGQKY